MDRMVIYSLVLLTILVPLAVARRVGAGKMHARRGLMWTLGASTAVIAGWLLAVWLLVPRLL